MSREAEARNIAHFRRFQQEVIVEGNFDHIDTLMAPVMIAHRAANRTLRALTGADMSTDAPKQMSREAFVRGRDAAVAGRTDHARRIVDIIASGNRVWARWTIEWTHDRPFAGLPPTGRRIVVEEVGILHFNDAGQLDEGWFMSDHLEMYQQMGARVRVTPGAGSEQEAG